MPQPQVPTRGRWSIDQLLNEGQGNLERGHLQTALSILELTFQPVAEAIVATIPG